MNDISNEVKAVEAKVEEVVLEWHISGWALVGLLIASNLVGVFLHF